jgi:hypothetical protein
MGSLDGGKQAYLPIIAPGDGNLLLINQAINTQSPHGPTCTPNYLPEAGNSSSLIHSRVALESKPTTDLENGSQLQLQPHRFIRA